METIREREREIMKNGPQKSQILFGSDETS